MDIIQKNYAKLKKPNQNWSSLYVSIYIKLLKCKLTCSDRKQISGRWGWGVGAGGKKAEWQWSMKKYLGVMGMCVIVIQSCPVLCSPMDCSPSDFSVHGIIPARILEWVALSSPGDLPNPGIEPKSPARPALAGGFFITVIRFFITLR